MGVFPVQFMEVWGTGEATAERWYREGCRTLNDIRQRTDLTSQQVKMTDADSPNLAALETLNPNQLKVGMIMHV